MTTKLIPPELMRIADRAEAADLGSNVEVIAQAIGAERERCAKIAESISGGVGTIIARAIRDGSDPSIQIAGRAQ